MEGQHEQEENPQRRVYLDQPEDHRSDQDAHDNLQHDRRKPQESHEPEAERHRKGASRDDEHPGELNLHYEQSSRAVAGYVDRFSLRPRTAKNSLRVLA
jgi:hypothetical protein